MSHNTIAVNNYSPDITSDIALSSSVSFAVFGKGETSAYSNSPATGLATNNQFYFYDTSPINNITGLTFSTTNNWGTQFTLPAGQYIVQWSFHLEYTSTGWYSHLNLKQSSTIVGTCAIGETSDAEQSNGWGIAYIAPTSNTTYDFELGGVANIDTVANQGTTPSEYGAFYIWKVAD
tara:strand:- start:716 stop:1246 length:531 start_codon:yes stop_codon:yes gene_type:complete